MILVCPNCMARYRIEVEALGATGRRVRCSKCHHVWRAEPPGYVVEVLHDEPPADHAEANGEPRQPQLPVPAEQVVRSRGPSLRIWVLSLVALALCIVAYEARHAIQTQWPWLAPAYEALGLDREDTPEAQPRQPE